MDETRSNLQICPRYGWDWRSIAGTERALGLGEGATEDAATVGTLLDSMINRGLEPALEFGGENRHVDIRFGLMHHGPIDLDSSTRPSQIQVGIVGSSESIVGITTTTASYQSALQIARAFRAAQPNAIIVFGGAHASPEAEIILAEHLDCVDFVIQGEGEVALERLITSYPNFEAVPNLAYRKLMAVEKSWDCVPHSVKRHSKGEAGLSQASTLRTFEVLTTPHAHLLNQSELDRIPITFRGEAPISSPGKFDHVTYVSARGCPLKCSFCAVANQVIRAKSVPAVIADLRYLTQDLGFRRIAIEDNFFAHSPRRTRELCIAIREFQDASGATFTWDCQTRVESMRSADIVELMQKAGCEAVYLGVESLSANQLTYLGKTVNPQHYLDTLTEHVVPLLLNSTVECFINLQVGLPDEDRSVWNETERLLRHMGQEALAANKKITIFPMLHVVYPGTTHFWNLVDDGVVKRDCFESFTAWEREQEPILNWLGPRFAHGTGGLPIGILRRDGLPKNIFDIDPSRVFRLLNYLAAIETIPGVVVFSYGKFLVKGLRDQADQHWVRSRPPTNEVS